MVMQATVEGTIGRDKWRTMRLVQRQGHPHILVRMMTAMKLTNITCTMATTSQGIGMIFFPVGVGSLCQKIRQGGTRDNRKNITITTATLLRSRPMVKSALFYKNATQVQQTLDTTNPHHTYHQKRRMHLIPRAMVITAMDTMRRQGINTTMALMGATTTIHIIIRLIRRICHIRRTIIIRIRTTIHRLTTQRTMVIGKVPIMPTQTSLIAAIKLV